MRWRASPPHRPTAHGLHRLDGDHAPVADDADPVDRLVDEGLLRRADADADARGVVVALIDIGVARLSEALPVHLQKVFELFVEPLDDHALAVLERALDKVTQTCSFG